ncbi:flagellar hook-associated protein FlgK [Methylopila sp. M107]|uniref:flagellar hook-associated protein FlgK n=1 Tax=Methylopila sp. M107 TaxID=1101190 RepID=UPI0003A1E21A|nr:flagellar hook-associated protein FlgK [Methylopila sp. M107]
MGLSGALSAALSGLKTTQRGLDLVSTNVANAQTVGYTRKSLVAEQTVTGGVTSGVKVSDVRRELDLYLQRQLRTESAGSAYASQRATTLDRLQSIFGTPGGALSLDTAVNGFSSALDALATSPDDGSARASVLSNAQALAQALNAASRDVQDLRSDVDGQIGDGVEAANEALGQVETLTAQIRQSAARGQPTGDLEDLRDAAIDTVSALMDVRVEDLGGGSIRIKTGGGLTLFDETGASTLGFEAAGTVTASMSYEDGTLGGLTLTRPSGQSVDLFESGRLRSGAFKALAELRDTTLPQAQAQLDEVAANLAQALGTNVTDGTAITGGVSLSTEGALSGDRLSVAYTAGGAARSVTIVNIGDPSKLPLKDDLTADPNDVVIGVDFASPTAAADLDAALGAKGIAIDVAASADGFAFTAGAAGTVVTGGQSRITATSLSGDGLALPLFTDADGAYSSSIDGAGQRAGFAGRISVNPDLLADPAKLTAYATGTASGDPARPAFLRDALKADRSFALDSGLGASSRPFTGSIAEFAQGIISKQASASASASRVADGQAMVVSTLTDKYSDATGVDVDQEMSNLIQLQTAYGANARVVTAVKEMMDMLLRM